MKPKKCVACASLINSTTVIVQPCNENSFVFFNALYDESTFTMFTIAFILHFFNLHFYSSTHWLFMKIKI